jgi:hypothetical protein
MPDGLKRYYGRGGLYLNYVQLLSQVAVAGKQEGACAFADE